MKVQNGILVLAMIWLAVVAVPDTVQAQECENCLAEDGSPEECDPDEGMYGWTGCNLFLGFWCDGFEKCEIQDDAVLDVGYDGMRINQRKTSEMWADIGFPEGASQMVSGPSASVRMSDTYQWTDCSGAVTGVLRSAEEVAEIRAATRVLVL